MLEATTRILLVDDDPQSLESTCKTLRMAEYEVVTATDGQAGLECLRAEGAPPFDLVVTDVRMPRLGGLEFLRALSLRGDNVPVILMTAFGRVEDAVWAMKFGAVDFLTKPFKRQQLLTAVEVALKRARPAASAAAHAPSHSAVLPPPAPGGSGAFGISGIVGRSAPIIELTRLVSQVAPTSATVLLSGESGTGKELIARSIHFNSVRAKARFIAINCAAVPDNLIESELFGFERGAFTGATHAREGLFEAANGGTLLLDEIGDMPLALQAKLLRVLQEGEVRRVGATSARKIDVRVIAASHRDLREAVREGRFREDLLYRLEVIGIHVPALRERREDIPELAAHFLRAACDKHSKSVGGPGKQIDEAAMRVLRAHSWPGNVRELSNVIERAVVFSSGSGAPITVAELPSHLVALATRPASERQAAPETAISVPLGTSLKDVEELLIRKTLEATSGDKNMTAKLLGINSRTIYRKLDRKPEP